MKAVAPTTFARMSESLMSRKPLHKRLSRGFATRRSLPPIVEKNWRQKLPGGSPQGCEMPAVLLGRGPLEAPLLKAAIIEPKPVVIPMQDLHFVPAAVTENKERRCKRIELERLAHQRHQPVNRLAHVRTAASQVD